MQNYFDLIFFILLFFQIAEDCLLVGFTCLFFFFRGLIFVICNFFLFSNYMYVATVATQTSSRQNPPPAHAGKFYHRIQVS